MRKSRFNDSQRQAILDTYLQGKKTVEALCVEHQISPATFYKWKNDSEVQKNDDKRRLKELESSLLLNPGCRCRWPVLPASKSRSTAFTKSSVQMNISSNFCSLTLVSIG
ncbi:MAG: transposase [Saprospiraceae bacterium]|nr:transposase [Saprospiraceae bacterium]